MNIHEFVLQHEKDKSLKYNISSGRIFPGQLYRWGPEQDCRRKLSQIKETHIYIDTKST